MKTFKQYIIELSNPVELKRFKSQMKDKTQVDTRDNSWMYTLTSMMNKYGFNKLGSGKYASVYGSANYPFVVKIFMKDAAYLKWIEFCLKNQSNLYVPKIKGKVIKLTDLFYAIRLEKLTPVGGEATKFMKEWDGFFENSKNTSDKDLQQVFDYLKPYTNLVDMHYENMMSRGKQVVVIDPLYNWRNAENSHGYTMDPDDISPSVFRSVFAK